MRKINTSDVFSAARAIKAAGLREELRPIVKDAAENGLSVEEIGIDGLLTAVEAMTAQKAEMAIYEVLSGPLEMPPEQIAKLPIEELLDNLLRLAQENDIKRFFTLASRLITTT